MTRLLSDAPISWPEVVFAAASTNDPFEDVRVITARSEFVAHAYEVAANYLTEVGIELSEEAIKAAALSLISSQKTFVREFVEIKGDDIDVCINVSSTTDDMMMFRALDMVQSALAQLGDADGIVYFGEQLQFSISEVADLILPV
jgi:hypothetical protein